MNFFNGDQLTKYEIKQRLSKINIPYDLGIVDKKYFVSLYNKAILSEENRLKIKEELTNDNSFRNLRRSLEPKAASKDDSSDRQPQSFKEKPLLSHIAKLEVVNEEEKEIDSVSAEDHQSERSESVKEAQPKKTLSSFISQGMSFGLGLGSMFAYQHVSAADIKAFINKLPSFEEIFKVIKDIVIPLKNWTILLIDLLTEMIKPYAKEKYSQFYSYITQLQFDDLTFILLVSVFVLISLITLCKLMCKKKDPKNSVKLAKKSSSKAIA